MAVAASAKGPAAPPAALDPNTPLTPQNIQAIATYLANQQVNGPISDLTSTIAQDNKQTTGAENLTGGYFGQLGQQAQSGVAQQGQIGANLNSTLAGIGTDTQNQLGGIGQNAMSSLLKYAPQSDPNNSLAQPALGSLATEIARQKGLAAQNTGTSRIFGAIQGGNYQGLAASNLGTFALRGQEALKGIAQAGQLRNTPLAAKIAALQTSRGGLIATNEGKLRQQEITNQIASAGLGIRQTAAQVAQQNANTNAKNAATQAKNAATTQQNDLANQSLHAAQLNEKTNNDAATVALKQAALNMKNGTGVQKALTTGQQNLLYRNLDEMMTLIGAAQKAGHNEGQIRQALQTGAIQKGFPAQSAVLVQAAYELLGWGHLTPATAGAMRNMGLRGGTFRGQPITVGPAPANPGNLGLGSALGGASLQASSPPF